MPTTPRRPDADAAQEPPAPSGPASGERLFDTPGETDEVSPTGLLTTDSWAEAADRTGTVEAKRQMPEPDSLGG